MACAKWWPEFIIIFHVWAIDTSVKFWLWVWKGSWIHHHFVCALLKLRSLFSLGLSSTRESCTYVGLKLSYHCAYRWPSTKQCRCISNCNAYYRVSHAFLRSICDLYMFHVTRIFGVHGRPCNGKITRGYWPESTLIHRNMSEHRINAYTGNHVNPTLTYARAPADVGPSTSALITLKLFTCCWTHDLCHARIQWRTWFRLLSCFTPGNGRITRWYKPRPELISHDMSQYRISLLHNNDVIMSAMASLITCVSMVCSTVCSGPDQRKHQSSMSLAFVRGIHRWPVNSTHKGPVTRKCFHLMTSLCMYCVVVSFLH